MAKAGNFKIKWDRSVTEDVTRHVVKIVNDGVESTMDLDANVTEMEVVVAATKEFSVDIRTVRDFVESVPVVYGFTCPSLEPPEPVTNVTHELTGTVDV